MDVDRTPPETVVFAAPDPADPRAVHVAVADATSGVARGRIELRRAVAAGGPWRRLPTTLAGGRLSALVDDAALAAGAYELRAVVADAAGNEAVGARRVDGAPATLRLPLRRRTALAVRRSGRLAARPADRRRRAAGRPRAGADRAAARPHAAAGRCAGGGP